MADPLESSSSITQDEDADSLMEHRQLTVADDLAGVRLDQALAQAWPEFSRSRISQWIKQGRVRVDGEVRRPKDKLLGGEQVVLEVELEAQLEFQAEPLPLDILFEDEDLLVLNKPPGLVVHPAAGNWQGTLLNGLLHHEPNLDKLPRAGIVHRLDKDTSGLLVVAKSLRAHTSLVAQLQARSVKRQYLAVVYGLPVAGGSVDAPIGRHPTQRTRMAVSLNGKEAITHYRVQERFLAHSLLQVNLETGRTHQIRVHLAHIKMPILGDPVYAGRLRLPAGASQRLIEGLRGFKRQALHAEHLRLLHPATEEPMEWRADIAPDMARLIELLREEAS